MLNPARLPFAFRPKYATMPTLLPDSTLASLGLDAFLLSTADEHLNEYTPLHNRRLEAATGFSGSAGTVIFVHQGTPQLFVDSRYHVQADQQCAESFRVQKLGNEGVPEPHEWLAQQQGAWKIGVDPFLMSPRAWKRVEAALAATPHQLVPITPNPVDALWLDRPAPAKSRPYALPLEWTGVSAEDKLAQVRNALQQQQAEVLLLTMLDEIAWLLNLRGSDVTHTPVFEAYAAVFAEQAICFCHHPEEMPVCPGWEFRPYDDYFPFLKTLTELKQVWLDPSGVTVGTQQAFRKDQLLARESPVVLPRALKNPAELACIRTAHQRAACALVRSFAWLERSLAAGEALSEKAFADHLYDQYAQEEGFTDLSFGTIAGAGSNGAIVHYGTPSADKALVPEEMLLVDSGIQCAGGTTDCTRTVSLGTPSDAQRHAYTRVLQAHLRLGHQVFPEGTNGTQLDAVVRSGLWNDGMDFGHGTGHGVGAFLGVHEGPQRIAPQSHEVAFQEGMVVSNEPGFYRSGWGGIRIENLCAVTGVSQEGFPAHPGGRRWLSLETLTLVPYDRRLIAPELLSPDEQRWLEAYHQRVYAEIHPFLNSEDQEWLRQACGV